MAAQRTKKSAGKATPKTLKKKPAPKPARKSTRSLSRRESPPALFSGPARSRRFGQTVNMNFGPAGESCQWHCVYCPYADGRKKAPEPKPARLDPSEIRAKLAPLLKGKPAVETILLGGNSEPTLLPNLKEVVEALCTYRKATKATWKLVAITNGTRLSDAAAREALRLVDEVWIKLDCADESLFQRAHHPAPHSPTLRDHVAAIRALGHPRIQTTLWRYSGKAAFQNWSAENLRRLLDLYGELRPEAVHLTTVRRRKLYEGIQPVPYEEMEAFAMRIAELGIPVEAYH